jgi:hypothetical protein
MTVTSYLLILLLPGIHTLHTYPTREACAIAGRSQHQAAHWRCFRIENEKPLPRPDVGLGGE